MKQIFWQIIVGILGLYLAILFVPGVSITSGEFTKEGVKTLILIGTALGLINYFIKPIVNFITFPLRLITFGLFGLVVNMAIIWTVDVFFAELVIPGLSAIFWTSIIVWFLGYAVPNENIGNTRNKNLP